MTTKSKSFGPTASVADTKTTIGSAYKTPQGGVIRRIRISAYNGVADKAGSAIVILESDQQKGPFEFSVNLMSGLTDIYPIQTQEIEVAIPTGAQEEWTVSMTSSEALEDVVISLMWETG